MGLVVAPPEEVVAENVVKPTEAVAEATTLVGRSFTLDAVVAVLVVKDDAVMASVASKEVVTAAATRR